MRSSRFSTIRSRSSPGGRCRSSIPAASRPCRRISSRPAATRRIGYYSVQAATNGLRFALEPEFAFQAKEAGFDIAYFQFDGVTNDANSHRHISNLFDAKLMAIRNMRAAGIEIVPVTTVVNTVNDSQVGPILQFIIDNCDKMGGVSFQPVSFTGRDEGISDADRHRQRYTLSHLAHELHRYFDGKMDPYRDWYPLGAVGGFTTVVDHLRRGPKPSSAARLLVPSQLRLERCSSCNRAPRRGPPSPSSSTSSGS